MSIALAEPAVAAPPNRGAWPHWAKLAFGALGLASLVALLAWTVSPSPTPLRIAINPWPGYEYAALAQEKGFFADEGVVVRLLDQSSLNDSRSAFDRGQADGFSGTVVEVLQSRALGKRNAQIVLVVDYSDGADVILARPDVRSLPDLRGKRIGLESGTLNEYVLARALEMAGLKWDDVERVHMSDMRLPSEFAHGRLDAVVTYPPASDEIMRGGQAHVVFDSKQIPGEVVDVIAFDETAMHTRAADIRGFLRAFHRAQRYAQDHPDEAEGIMAVRERISVEEFRAHIGNGIRIVGESEQAAFLGRRGTMPAVVERTAEVLQRAGVLRGGGRGGNPHVETESPQ